MRGDLSVSISESNAPCEDRYSSKEIVLEGVGRIFGYGVFDGHGGIMASEIASVQLLEVIFRLITECDKLTLENNQVITKLLNDAFLEVDQSILSESMMKQVGYSQNVQQDSNLARSASRVGCCGLVLLIISDVMHFAHVGDCRAVLCRNKVNTANSPRCAAAQVAVENDFNTIDLHITQLEQAHPDTMIQSKKRKQPSPLHGGSVFQHSAYSLEIIGVTTDHSPANHLEALALHHRTCDPKPIRKSENDKKVKFAPVRVAGSLSVTRAFGDGYLKTAPLSVEPYINMLPYLTCRPTVTTKHIDPGDSFIILASDGLWNYISAKELHSVMRQASASTQGIPTQSNHTLPSTASPSSLFANTSATSETNTTSHTDMSSAIVDRCLDIARNHWNISREEFDALQPGNARRDYIDDITVMVISL